MIDTRMTTLKNNMATSVKSEESEGINHSKFRRASYYIR